MLGVLAALLAGTLILFGFGQALGAQQARGAAPRPADIAAINEAAVRPPLVPRLTENGAAVMTPGTTQQAHSTLARDAIDLFGSSLAQRIRVFAAEDCGLLFVDASRPGRRRWCSMERCGDRAKKRTARRSHRSADEARNIPRST